MIKVYGGEGCSFCDSAVMLLETNGIDYVYVDIYDSADAKKEIMELGCRTIPQIFEGDEHIGGYDQLVEWFKK